jgi:hypothetical protein
LNLRFVDCYYELRAERDSGGYQILKKGCTPIETGEVITLRFDQMEDINVWTFMEVIAWSNEPVEEPEEVLATPMGDQID